MYRSGFLSTTARSSCSADGDTLSTRLAACETHSPGPGVADEQVDGAVEFGSVKAAL